MKSTTEGVGAAKPLGATPPFSVVRFFHSFFGPKSLDLQCRLQIAYQFGVE